MDGQAPPSVDADAERLRARPIAHHDEQTPLLRQSSEQSTNYDQSTSSPNFSIFQSWRKPSIIWLLPFLLLFMLGFGGLAVPKINLTVSLVCRDYLNRKASQDPNFTYLPVIIGKDNPQCQTPEVQSSVARFQLYLNLISGVLSAWASPRLGHLSDRYGRTSIIAINALTTVLAELVVVIVAANSEYMPVNVLLIGALLDGIGGSYTSVLALTTSYASDCTSSERRSVAFGYLHGCLFTGTAVGPLIVAFILKKTGNILHVFYFMLGLHVLFFLAMLLVIPESLSKERQQSAREKRQKQLSKKEPVSWLSFRQWNPAKVFTPLLILFPPAGRPSAMFPNRRGASPALRRNIILLSVIDTVVLGVALGTAQIVIIYAGYMFGWGNIESSLFISILSTVRVLNLIIVLPIVTWFFRGESSQSQSQSHGISGSNKLEITLIRVSLLFDMLAYTGYTLARSSSVLILSGVVAALGGMGLPTLQSSLTKHVPHDRIGQVLGAKGLLHALARVIAPTICSLIYSVTVGKYTPTVFLCLATVFGIAFGSSFYLKSYVRLEDYDSSDTRVEANEDGEDADDSLLRR